MSKEKRRVPKLRFPGFTEDWEQRKFGDLFEYERPDAYIVKSDNYNNDFNMPVLTANKAFILGYTNEENSYNKPSIIFDDFTLDRKYVDFPYMLKSSAIKILTSKNQHNLRFLFERLNSTRFEVLGHARHYISVVQNTTTFCPSVDEEICISNLLTKFDELITLHQRKLEHLNLKKKALLQKLFPKNGERYPKLRFPGFTDAWEQRKFKDLFIERREKTIRENEETLLSCAITGIYLNSELFSHFRGSSTIGYLKIKKYDLILSAQNLHLGNANINLSFDKGMISPAYKVFELKSIDPYFINAWVKKDSTKNFFLKATTEGASQCRKNIEWDVLLNQEIPVPNKLEQRTIGRFINNIDMIITLHQRKLEHLQLQKKALLQQMFV